MDELWMRSVATVYDGKIEDFKRLAEEMLSTIRDKDSDTLNFAIFLDEPTRVAVFLDTNGRPEASTRSSRPTMSTMAKRHLGAGPAARGTITRTRSSRPAQ
jgi:hypothetical protein